MKACFRCTKGSSKLMSGQNLDHLDVGYLEKIGIAAFIQQQPDTPLVIGQRKGKEGAIVARFEVLADGCAYPGILGVRFVPMLADQQLLVKA
jgi:hypothetical protein